MLLNPDAPEIFPGIADYMARPDPCTPPERIPVAVCCRSKSARQCFSCYFKNHEKELISEVMKKRVHCRENVFIISLLDLYRFITEHKISVFSKNGLPFESELNDRDWCWENVIGQSRLLAGWYRESEDSITDPKTLHRQKVRILMDGLETCKCGDTVRFFKGDSVLENMVWPVYWTGEDVICNVINPQ